MGLSVSLAALDEGKATLNADIAVHQFQAVVVLGHQYRAAFIPAFLQRVVTAEQQLFATQRAGDALV